MTIETSLPASSIPIFLVDDQPIVHEAIRRMLSNHPEFALYSCLHASQAIAEALKCEPSVIIQDLLMPDGDGMALVKEYRAHPALANVPLIVLSSKEDPLVKAEAFALGANDYLVKLPAAVELIARIRYHAMAYIRLLERNQAYHQIEDREHELVRELEEAASYVTSLLPKPLHNKAQHLSVDWRFIPSRKLGGDSFGYHWIDENHLALYVMDVCGHGVGAALLSVSVLNVLRSETMSLDYKDPAAVLEGINKNFPMEQHNEMFLTMCYCIFDVRTHKMRYSIAGHPPPVLVHPSEKGGGQATSLAASCGPVIGVLEKGQFTSSEVEVKPGDCLYLFSDGLYEISKKDKEIMSYQEFVPLFAKLSTKGKERVLDLMIDHCKSLVKESGFDDDVCLLQVSF